MPRNPASLTVAEAAEFLGRAPNTVRKWADDGLIPHEKSKTNGERRFRQTDLEDFRASMRRPVKEAS